MLALRVNEAEAEAIPMDLGLTLLELLDGNGQSG